MAAHSSGQTGGHVPRGEQEGRCAATQQGYISPAQGHPISETSLEETHAICAAHKGEDKKRLCCCCSCDVICFGFGFSFVFSCAYLFIFFLLLFFFFF